MDTATADYMTISDIAALSNEGLVARYAAADAAWEVDRRSGGWSAPNSAGGWNYAQREERNDLANEIMRRKSCGLL